MEDTFGEGDGFRLADGFNGGVDLPVGVSEAEVVKIDQGEFSDAGAREGFDGPGSDSAKSNDHDMGSGEFFKRGKAVKSGDASKAVKIILGHRRILCPRCGLNKSEDSDKRLVTTDDDQRRS